MKFRIIILLLINYNISIAQNEQFPDKLDIEFVRVEKLEGISYQDIRRFPKTKSIKNSTSFFISKNFLLTSAHNVTKLPFHSVKYITIYPSRIGNKKHLDSIFIKINYKRNIKYPKKYNFYRKKTRIPHDIALIYIPDSIINSNIKLNSLPFIPLVSDTMKIKEGDMVYCVGYPAEKEYHNKYIMTMDSSIVSKVHKNYFEHRLGTLKGNSGSPIMIKRDGVFYVVGVNSIKYNGTLINAEKKDLIKYWISELKKSH